MDKLAMHTPNLVERNIERIAALFPNVVTEKIVGYKTRRDGTREPIVTRAIDFDALRQELSDVVVEGPTERYAFTWPDKRRSMLAANAPIAKTMRPCREESVDFDSTENLYIEGDNLDALKLMLEAYLGKIKMIYIDPPYNTGSDFVYEDDFAENTEVYREHSGEYDDEGGRLVQNLDSNGRFHTDWLNMLYPRLRLAKDLLSDDGVIFISIDDNEVHNLRKICDEVFGGQCHAATFLWTKTSTPPSLSHKCRKTVEYVLVYERKPSTMKYYGAPLDGGDAPLLNTGNPVKTITFPVHSIRCSYMQNGTIAHGKKDRVFVEDDIDFRNHWNTAPVRITGEFKWEQSTVDTEVIDGTYFIIKTPKCAIRFQRANLEDSYKTPTNHITIELNKGEAVGTNESAVKEMEGLGLAGCFDFPKPVSLLYYLVRMLCNFDKEAYILDFFSGSATTAHAVMQLNAEDGGHRKFIMVQLEEETAEDSEAYKAGYKTICEIGKERIRRAGAKIKADSPLTTMELDVGFRVLKIASSNMLDVYYKPDEYKQDKLFEYANNIRPDRTSEDLLFQVMLDLGVLLSSKIEETMIDGKKVFSVEDGYLIACFDEGVTDETVTAIAQRRPYFAVFRDSCLSGDSTATNFEQVFKQYSPGTTRRVL